MIKLQNFDIRTVTQAEITLITQIYKDDPFMQAERVNRHYGIASESNFSLQMFRWANKIIEFVDVTKNLEKLGIYELENHMNQIKTYRGELQRLVGAEHMFRQLKINNQLVIEVEEMSHHMSQFSSDDAKSMAENLEFELSVSELNNEFEESKEEQIDTKKLEELTEASMASERTYKQVWKNWQPK